jgi:hypothetical protein
MRINDLDVLDIIVAVCARYLVQQVEALLQLLV